MLGTKVIGYSYKFSEKSISLSVDGYLSTKSLYYNLILYVYKLHI